MARLFEFIMKHSLHRKSNLYQTPSDGPEDMMNKTGDSWKKMQYKLVISSITMKDLPVQPSRNE